MSIQTKNSNRINVTPRLIPTIKEYPSMDTEKKLIILIEDVFQKYFYFISNMYEYYNTCILF